MSNYYDMRKAKVRIAMELSQRGWKIYGFKEDESDSMTDYYNPSSWGGIATKNGFVLVVDNFYSSYSEQEISIYNHKENKNISNNSKIESLKNMTVKNGCTIEEEKTSQNLLKKLQEQQEENIKSGWTVIDRYPKYQKNPSKNTKWHIEKQDIIYDKGNGILKFADIPENYEYDITKMEYTENYKFYYNYVWNSETGERETEKVERKLNDEELKAINEFKSFITRIERIVTIGNMCKSGNSNIDTPGDKQQENEKMILVKKQIKKKEIKLSEIDKQNIEVGDIFKTQQGYFKCIEIEKNTCIGHKLMGKTRKFALSNASDNIVYWDKKSIENNIKTGYRKLYKIEEVEIVTEVEKWERQKPVKQTFKKENKTENNTNVENEVVAEQQQETQEQLKVEIKLNEEKNGIELYFNEKPSEEIRSEMKQNIGYRWHKNNYWYCKNTGDKLLKTDNLIKKYNIEIIEINKKENEIIESEEIEEVIQVAEIVDNIELEEIETNTTFETVEQEQQKEMLSIVKELLGEQEQNNNSSFETLVNEEIETFNNIGEEVVVENNNIDDIFKTLDNIEINESRLSKEDLEFCQEQEQLFKNSIELLNNFLIQVEELEKQSNSIGDKYGIKKTFFHKATTSITYSNLSIEQIKKDIIKITKNYISVICNYFSDKYKVNIDIEKLQLQYESLNTFEKILDILLKDGLTFEEMGIKELEEKIKESFKYKKPSVKNNKVILNNYFALDSSNLKYGTTSINYHYKDAIYNLFECISYFNTSDIKNNIYIDINNKIYNSNDNTLINTYTLENNNNKIELIRLYKNGKIELNFNNNSLANQFYNKFCK